MHGTCIELVLQASQLDDVIQAYQTYVQLSLVLRFTRHGGNLLLAGHGFRVGGLRLQDFEFKASRLSGRQGIRDWVRCHNGL